MRWFTSYRVHSALWKEGLSLEIPYSFLCIARKRKVTAANRVFNACMSNQTGYMLNGLHINNWCVAINENTAYIGFKNWSNIYTYIHVYGGCWLTKRVWPSLTCLAFQLNSPHNTAFISSLWTTVARKYQLYFLSHVWHIKSVYTYIFASWVRR